MTTMAGWSPGDDRESRLRDGLSLPPVRPAAQVAWSSCRPLQAYWSCELSARATSPSTLCVSVPSTGWRQPGMATQGPCMLTRTTSSGTLSYLDGLFGPPWVIKGILGAFWMIGPHTHRPRGGSDIGRVAVTCHQKLFSCGCLCCTIRNRLPPDRKPLTTTCSRLRKR